LLDAKYQGSVCIRVSIGREPTERQECCLATGPTMHGRQAEGGDTQARATRIYHRIPVTRRGGEAGGKADEFGGYYKCTT
jgi:hypothetical protein